MLAMLKHALHGDARRGPAQKTGTASQYRAKVKADMAGDWQAKISFDGPRGKGETNFSVNVR